MGRGRRRGATRWSVIATAVVLCLSLSGCDWAMFGYGPEHRGYNPSETKIAVDNVGTLTAAWTATPLGASDSSAEASPAVVDGVLYMTGNHSSDTATTGWLFAFDAAGSDGCSGSPTTCTPLWGASFGRTNSSPTVVDGVVYVTGEAYNTNAATLYAFDAAGETNCSGTPKRCSPLWTAPVGTASSSTSTVANGVVYVRSNVYLWAFDAAGQTGCSGTPTTCEPLWTSESLGSSVTDVPAVANGMVYTSAGNNLYAFDAAGATNCGGAPITCNPVWSVATGGAIRSSPAISGVPLRADPMVFVGSEDHNLYALNATTGALVWYAPTLGKVESTPAVANGVVYAASADGVFTAYDGAGVEGCSVDAICTGLWHADVGAGSESSAAVANGVVYVGGADRHIHAFAADGCFPDTTCSPLFDKYAGYDLGYSSPTVANGVVYMSLTDGFCHACYAKLIAYVPAPS